MHANSLIWTYWRRSQRVSPYYYALNSSFKSECSFMQHRYIVIVKTAMQDKEAQNSRLGSATQTKYESSRISKPGDVRKETRYAFQGKPQYQPFQNYSKATGTIRYKHEPKSCKGRASLEEEQKHQISGQFQKDDRQGFNSRNKRLRKDSTQEEIGKECKQLKTNSKPDVVAPVVNPSQQKEVSYRQYKTQHKYHRSQGQTCTESSNPSFQRGLSPQHNPKLSTFRDNKNQGTQNFEFNKPRKNTTPKKRSEGGTKMIPVVEELFRQHSTKMSLNSNVNVPSADCQILDANAEISTCAKDSEGISNMIKQNITLSHAENQMDELEDGEIVDNFEEMFGDRHNDKKHQSFGRRDSNDDVEIVERINRSPRKNREIHSGRSSSYSNPGKLSSHDYCYNMTEDYKRNEGKRRPSAACKGSENKIYRHKHLGYLSETKLDKLPSVHRKEGQSSYVVEEDWDAEITKAEQELSVLKSDARIQGKRQSVSSSTLDTEEISISPEDDTGHADCGKIEHVSYNLSSSNKNTDKSLSQNPNNTGSRSAPSNFSSTLLPSQARDTKVWNSEFRSTNFQPRVPMQGNKSMQHSSVTMPMQSFYPRNPINVGTGFRPTPPLLNYMSLLQQAIQFRAALLSPGSSLAPNHQYNTLSVNQNAWTGQQNISKVNNNVQSIREHKTKTSGHQLRINVCAGKQSCPEISSSVRKWHHVQAVNKSAGEMEFTVMSYNILSQMLMEQHPDLYYNCRDHDLEWKNRGPALVRQIIAHSADIVCLQEVQEDHWMFDIKSNMEKHGYDCVFKKRIGDKPDGCAILYKRDKFEQLKLVPVEFMRGGILDRDNIGIILLLQPKKEFYFSGDVKKICVATTHLLFNPRRGDIKLAQLMILLAEIDKYAYQGKEWNRKDENIDCITGGLQSSSSQQQSNSSRSQEKEPYKDGSFVPLGDVESPEGSMHKSVKKFNVKESSDYCPIIMCGDFNSEPFSDLYRFITTGSLKYEGLVSRLICGQKEGQRSGSDKQLVRHLIPVQLSIAESCQYTNVMQERRRGSAPLLPGKPDYVLKVNSGNVFHHMNFCSAYRHFVDRPGPDVREVTTHHMKSSSTVDYIFYSSNSPRDCHKRNDKKTVCTNKEIACESSVDPKGDTTKPPALKEPLLLLARYRLMSTNEVAKTGYLPNSTFPSDHLCLIAKFLLR